MYKEHPLWKKGEAFAAKFIAALKTAKPGDILAIKDDMNRAVFTMKYSIKKGLEAKNDTDIMIHFGMARGKTGALDFYLDFSADMGVLPAGDALELKVLLDEIYEGLTEVMKRIKPDLDEWKKDLPEFFGDEEDDKGYNG